MGWCGGGTVSTTPMAGTLERWKNREPTRNNAGTRMQIGDLVTYGKYIGIVTCIDPEELGDLNEVEVVWHDGEVSNHCKENLGVVNEDR